MKPVTVARASELQVWLGTAQGELVRGFVREAALSDGAPAVAAGHIASDTAAVWRELCALASGGAHARIVVLGGRQGVRTDILLRGHSRFAGIATCFARCVHVNSGFSWRERGIDGWEISIHHSFAVHAEQPPEFATEQASSSVKASVIARDYDIDVPQEKDAPGIARCFLEVYGRTYVHPEVFAPHRYWREVESGQLMPVVARNSQGEVVGHVALERGPGTEVAERGEAVVLSAHRGQGLLERMTERLSEEASKHELHGVYAEPLTIHTFSQRNDERAGMPVCAVLLGANPENYHPRGLPGAIEGQRQSYLRTFRFVKQPAARVIHAPAVYRDMLLRLYARLGAKVSVANPAQPAVGNSSTGIGVNARGYGEISFERIGTNANIELGQALRDVRALGASSVRLSATLDDPGLPLLTDSARALGFFFCGLGPAFANGSDTLQLQCLSELLDTSKLQLFTKAAEELVAYIDTDRSEAARNAGIA